MHRVYYYYYNYIIIIVVCKLGIYPVSLIHKRF